MSRLSADWLLALFGALEICADPDGTKQRSVRVADTFASIPAYAAQWSGAIEEEVSYCPSII